MLATDYSCLHCVRNRIPRPLSICESCKLWYAERSVGMPDDGPLTAPLPGLAVNLKSRKADRRTYSGRMRRGRRP